MNFTIETAWSNITVDRYKKINRYYAKKMYRSDKK